MMRYGFLLLACLVVLSGCGKKTPVLSPEMPVSVVGEYEFTAVGLGAGHGFMFLPGVVQDKGNIHHVIPGGIFTFYNNNNFKIEFKILKADLAESGTSELNGWPSFYVEGTYRLTSKNTITLRTPWGSSEYLYALNMTGIDGTHTVHLQLMPMHPWHPLEISDPQHGRAIFDVIYLSRKIN